MDDAKGAVAPGTARTQASITASLQFRLSLFLMLAILVIAGGAGVFTYVAAMDEAHEQQDKQLRQIAHLISRFQTGPVTLAAWKRIAGVRLEERLVVRFLQDNAPPPSAPPHPHFSNLLRDGLQTVLVGPEHWRVFVKTEEKGVRIAVAQQTVVRDAAARGAALRSLLPFALSAPVLIVLVGLLIGRMFRPLRTLSEDLRGRDENNLAELDPRGLPSEIQPFVAEINRLLQRVERTLAHQRRFVADAAHELRSPLTAMTLQAERLSAADMPAEARQRMQDLSSGLQRTRVLLDQLLALARSQQAEVMPLKPVSMQRVLRGVLEQFFPLAEARSIDLGMLADDDALIMADQLELTVLVKNLVDNAIRFTPPGGRVDISVTCAQDAATLLVDDTGPGIAPEERGRVFDPFYRVLGNSAPGSGLGLAIVRAVADKLGAQIDLEDAPGGGLRVRVSLPRSSRGP